MPKILLRDRLRSLMPDALLQAERRLRVKLRRRMNARRPAGDVFNMIYASNAWGGAPGDYYSGPGSDDLYSDRFADKVRDVIRRFNISTIVDLGCGDFRVGEKLLKEPVRYIGVDIVAALIERNRRKHGNGRVSFACLDVIADDLPPGELALVRQVLQHLSNAEILIVLRKLAKYPYLIITEHYPAPSSNVVPNRDMPHGADTRILDGSGVYLDLPPFNVRELQVLDEEQVREPLVAPGEVFRSFLVVNNDNMMSAATGGGGSDEERPDELP